MNVSEASPEELKADGWIDVGDALPRNYGLYEVLYLSGCSNDLVQDACCYRPTRGGWSWCGGDSLVAKYWRPIEK